ncbi:MAG TPA: TonB-dependent receptor [Bryobacteraceae bacterium]|nr:TonB-dependent receptor [Bryobacteraceae bacterium]
MAYFWANHLGVLGVCLLAGNAAWAQSAVTADLQGTVADGARRTVSGALLTAVNVETGVKRTTVTNSFGRYRIAALAAGEYVLTVVKEGFATVERKGLALEVGQAATVDFELTIASQSQTITVVADTSVVDTGRSAVGPVVDRTEIDNLPIDGRNFLDFAQTVGGVTDQQTSGQGSGISFNGQRGRSNNISIDGVDHNGQLNGNVRLTMSQDAVREFQVVTNGFAPEFGNAGGGLVNVVSRSGTNNFHGTAFFYLRNEALDGRNAFITTAQKPPFRRKNIGATVGGPIAANRTFFFSSVEYIARHESGAVTIPDASVAAINSVLASRPIPNSGVRAIANGVFPIGEIETLSSIKLDHLLTPNDSLVFRYLFGQDRQSNSGGVGIGGLIDVSGGGGQRTRDQSFLWGWTHVFSPTLLAETRVQYAPRRLTQYANDSQGPHVSISGVADFGRNANFPVLLDEGREQWQQSFSKQHGRHFFKIGSDLQWIHAHTSFPVNFAGTFSFASLADFAAGRVNLFSQGFGDPEIRLPDTLIAFYLQDTFQASPKLSITYGLRYDYDRQPQGIRRDPNNPIEAPLQTGIPRDPNNVAPRLGMAYQPFRGGKTVIRAGYGIFYDKLFLLVARNALIARQTLSLSQAQSTAQLALGAFPQSNAVPSGFNLPKGSLNTVANSLATPYAQQANLGVEQALAGNWAVSATYVWVRGVHLLRSQNINLGPPVILTPENAAQLGVASPNPQQLGRGIYLAAARPSSAFTNIQQVSSSANSFYNGLELSLSKRFARGFEMRVNYTFSKAIDDASDFVQAQQPSDPYDARAERSLSLEDQRRRFTLTGVWQVPYLRGGNALARKVLGDWVLAANCLITSGSPLNVTVGSDVNLDGNNNDRPFNGTYILGRNTYLGPGRAVVNLRLSRRFAVGERASLQVLGEAFNMENRVNFSGVLTTWGTGLQPRPTLGNYTSAGNAREVQLGLRAQF